MQKLKTVSLCMIVKNEEKYLFQCLSSVKDVVDEIIIVDTGSTDQTLEIAKSFGAKIFYYEWDAHFSNARNFSLSKATGDWILLLDADEALEHTDRDKLIQLINESTIDGYIFTIYNYTGAYAGTDFSIHHTFRLLRNNKGYIFKGAIHEQVIAINEEISVLPFEIAPIIVHHYGYLSDVITEKDKRGRNIPIIEKQLETDPHNAFYLFNLGNEYLAANQLFKALEIYKLSRQNLSGLPAFTAYLFYRMAICCTHLKKYEEALIYADEVLEHYPQFTDIIYCKGIIFYNCHQYTLAIDAFEKCLEMGEPPILLKFLDGCSTYKPYLILGDIYRRLNDLDRAIGCFSLALSMNNSLTQSLYDIATLLNKKYKDKSKVDNRLREYFVDLETLPYLLTYTDLLITEQLYEIAKDATRKIDTMTGYEQDRYFLLGKFYFFTYEYDLAYDFFRKVIKTDQEEHILKAPKVESLKFLFVLCLLYKSDKLSSILDLIKGEPDLYFQKVYEEIYNLYSEIDKPSLSEEDDPKECLLLVIEFLDKLLKLKDFDNFEKYLYLLNKIESRTVLLQLAKLYDRNGYKDMAGKTIVKSIKELDTIDIGSLDFLASMF